MSREFDLGKRLAIVGVAAFISAGAVKHVFADDLDCPPLNPINCIQTEGSTGRNSAGNNTGGDVSIVTGDASSTVTFTEGDLKRRMWILENCGPFGECV